jgi:hypothetical protein
MTYVCIKCRKIWVSGDHTSEYSGGLCEACTTGYIREKQKNYGFHDCFKRAIEVCSRRECSYWLLCIRDVIG